MTAGPFVDTNILVYAHDAADHGKQQRARDTLRAHADELVLSAQVLSETYVVLTQRLGMTADDARAIVNELCDFAVVTIDDELVRDAMATSTAARLSYWDALIVAAARRAGCDTLLTEDLSHGTTIDGVRVENPFAG